MFEVLQMLLTVFYFLFFILFYFIFANEMGEVFLLGGNGDANIHEPLCGFWMS